MLKACCRSSSWKHKNTTAQGASEQKRNRNEIFLLILVLSAPKGFSQRDIIRKTWGSSHKAIINGENVSRDWRMVFLIGDASEQETNAKIEAETKQYNDILRLNVTESYRNLVFKVLEGLKWASTLNIRFVLKTDDDCYIHTERLVKWLREASLPERFYGGYVHRYVVVNRTTDSKFFVSLDDFQDFYYPHYCSGNFYFLSSNILEDMIAVSQNVKKLTIEDAYIGILAKRCRVEPFDIGSYIAFSSEHLSSKLPEWEDGEFLRFFCLGHYLDPKWMQYIHARYHMLMYRMQAFLTEDDL